MRTAGAAGAPGYGTCAHAGRHVGSAVGRSVLTSACHQQCHQQRMCIDMTSVLTSACHVRASDAQASGRGIPSLGSRSKKKAWRTEVKARVLEVLKPTREQHGRRCAPAPLRTVHMLRPLSGGAACRRHVPKRRIDAAPFATRAQARQR